MKTLESQQVIYSLSDFFMETDLSNCVKRLVQSWTGYQLGLKMQCAGPSTSQKADWFLDILVQHLSNTKNLHDDDLADWIADILSYDFDLILEDGSCQWIARQLVTYKNLLQNGEHEMLRQAMAKLPSAEAVQGATASSVLVDDSDEYERDVTETIIEETEEGSENSAAERSSEQVHKDMPDEQMDTSNAEQAQADEDGWTVVSRRKKH